jgi:integrase
MAKRIPARISLKPPKPRFTEKRWAISKVQPFGKSILVGNLVTLYLQSERFKRLSPASKRSYYTVFENMENFVLPNNRSIMRTMANKIDFFVTEYVKVVLGHTVHPATIAQMFSVMSVAWNNAKRIGYVYENPWEKPGIRVNNFREVTWTDEEVNRAIAAAKANGYLLLALYIRMAYETGQRPWSDLRELKWENVKVETNGDFYLDFIIAKTKQHILLPLSKDAKAALDALPRTTSEYIFVTETGQHLTSAAMFLQLARVKKIAGLNPSLSMRDLRRTAVTQMAMAGATVSEITACTGWRVSEKVLNRYAVLKYTTAKNCQEKRDKFRLENDSLSSSAKVCADNLPTTRNA